MIDWSSRKKTSSITPAEPTSVEREVAVDALARQHQRGRGRPDAAEPHDGLGDARAASCCDVTEGCREGQGHEGRQDEDRRRRRDDDDPDEQHRVDPGADKGDAVQLVPFDGAATDRDEPHGQESGGEAGDERRRIVPEHRDRGQDRRPRSR